MKYDDDLTRGLWYVARPLEACPRFMAYELARMRADGIDPAGALGINDHQLVRLALCRSPHRDGRFVADVITIAAYIGMDADRLTNALCP